MNKQDILNQIEWHLEETEGENASGTFDQGYKEGCYHCEALIEQLDEPKKVKVPQFVAEWIETAKKEKRTLHYSMQDIDDACYYHKGDDPLYRWMFVCDDSSEHQEIFARAWLDGYEVEEEPKWKIINDQNYCLTSIEAGYGNSLHWAFDSTKKRPILFDNEETAMYTAYITGGIVEKV